MRTRRLPLSSLVVAAFVLLTQGILASAAPDFTGESLPEHTRRQIRTINQEIQSKLQGSMPGRSSAKREIQALLAQRAHLLKEVIRCSGEWAAGTELSRQARASVQGLGLGTADLLEYSGEWEGNIEVLAVDDFLAGTSWIVYYLHQNERTLELSLPPGVTSPFGGQKVKVAGVRLDNLVAAAEWQLQQPADVPVCTTTGEQKIAVLLVSFPSKRLLSSVTPQMMQDTFFGPGVSVDGYLRESSFNKTRATGQVFGPLVLDGDYLGQPLAVRDAAVRALGFTVDLRAFTRIVLVVPQAATGLLSGGLGSVGCSEIPLPTGPSVASTSWLGDASMGSPADVAAAAIHEMGHNLGLLHARAADFGNETLGPLGQRPAPWDQVHDYGDVFSNMGRGLGHWAAPHKVQLGWLDGQTDIATLETNGSVTLGAYEAGSGPKALRLRRGSGNDAWLWLENRQPVGAYDATLPNSAFAGALVHYEDGGWQDQSHTNLLRFNAAEDTGFFSQAPLAAGSSWTDPYSNLGISVKRLSEDRLQIDTTFAPAPTCPGSLSTSTFSFAPEGGTGSMNITAPAGCSWSATSSASWVKIESGSSGTGNAKLTFSVSANGLVSDRWARIQVGALTAVVTQAGIAGQASISPLSQAFPATGGVGQFSVATNAPDFGWGYGTDSPSWIQSIVSSKAFTVGPATLRYIVAPNTTSVPRTGTITAAGLNFTVNQAAGGPTACPFVWRQIELQDAPLPRHSMDVASFPPKGEFVFYGGAVDLTHFDDTWVWDGSQWIRKSPSHSPGERAGHAMVYDAGREKVLLFGGYADEYSEETWTWDGSDWSKVSTTSRPSGRTRTAMVYDPASGKVVLFGGSSPNGAMGDTWEWDGVDWKKIATPSAPPARYDHAMAYDAARRAVVLFGGSTDLLGHPAWFSDTWLWDGSRWRLCETPTAPAPREGHRMEYHPGLGKVILIGGRGGKNVQGNTYEYDFFEETWSWDGANWVQLFPNKSPELSYSYGLAYDPIHAQLITFIGDDLHCADRGLKIYVLETGSDFRSSREVRASTRNR